MIDAWIIQIDVNFCGSVGTEEFETTKRTLFFFLNLLILFIFGCVGSSLLGVGFL